MTACSRNRSAKGSVLILALWTLILLTIFSVSVGFAARQKATLMSRLEDNDQLFNMAYSGVLKMGSVLLKEESNSVESILGTWCNNALYFKDVEIAGGTFTFETPVYDEAAKKTVNRPGAVDEESKLNLNTADAETIIRLLRDGLGFSEDTSFGIAYAIVDWRDSDSFYGHPNFGAEDQDYKELDPAYGAKDEPFEILDELLLVRGINREIFDRIKPFVTVYGTGAVNINTASRPVLTALGLPSTLIDKIMDYRAGPDKEPGNGDANIFMDASKIVENLELMVAVDKMENDMLKALADQNKIGVGSDYFRVEVKAEIADKGSQMKVEAVLKHTGKVVYLRSIAV